MQAPGRPDEDVRGGFEHGGWALPYSDEVTGNEMAKGFGRSEAAVRAPHVREPLLVLGTGLRLFPEGGPVAKLRLTDSVTTTTGVVIATYRPASA